LLTDLTGMSRAAAYHLLTQVLVPRPIAWVLSDNGHRSDDELDDDAMHSEQRWNLAPYSFFNGVSADPPTVMFSVSSRPSLAAKDTLTNILARPHHTIALPHVGQLDAVQRTSEELPPGVSELPHAGIAALDWDWPTPRPAGARIALACTLDQIVPIGDRGQRMALSRVHQVWVDDVAVGVDAKGRVFIDPVALDPLARLGAGLYAPLGRPVLPFAGEASS
jgi:flavin reductase (DIM6/NTAB) family NADH-FMN oxidoreductase RutF